jgi:acyl-CoA thioesterase
MDYQKQIEMTNEKNRFMSYNFMKLTQMWEDHAVVELETREESQNLFGGIHGGVLITMADCAAGAAARSRGARYVTLSNSFEFFRTSKNDFLRAIATVRHRGKTICVVSVDVKDGEDKLLAGGTFTMFATGELEV